VLCLCLVSWVLLQHATYSQNLARFQLLTPDADDLHRKTQDTKHNTR
jgi:hypothetical protein